MYRMYNDENIMHFVDNCKSYDIGQTYPVCGSSAHCDPNAETKSTYNTLFSGLVFAFSRLEEI